MKAVVPALAPAGAVLLVLGVVVGVPVFGATPLGLALVMVGGAMLIVSALAPAPSAARRSGQPTAALGVVFAVATYVVGAIASVHLFSAVDITAARTNTLAEESVAVAKGLQPGAQVTAFLDDDRASKELSALIERYREYAPSLSLAVMSTRRSADLERARALGVAEHLQLGGPNVVIEAGGQPARVRFAADAPDAEVMLTNALRRAAQTRTAKVYVVAGHGEPDIVDDGPAGLARVARALRARGVVLVPLPLPVVGRVPDDAAGLLIATGTVALADAERAALAAALDAGVGAVLLLEPEGAAGAPLSSLAASLGVDVAFDVVVDESAFSTMLGGADLATGEGVAAHPVTRPLQGALTHFARAAVLSTSPTDGVSATAIISTGASARGPQTGAAGPLPLVVGVTATRGETTARYVVAADTSFTTNAYAPLGANLELAQNAVLWVSAVDDAIAVRPRAKSGALVFLTPSRRATLVFVLVLLVPGAVLAGAVGWGAVRRSR